MSRSATSDPERAALRSLRLVLAAVALAYVGGHLAWYGATPMGGYPVLDGREIVGLALAIAQGELPAEPFYRAPLYSALLALPAALGVPAAALPDLARLINLLAHIGSTLLVFELARALWSRTAAGLLAGLLYALYPVHAHFAGDPLDISLAIFLSLAATWFAWRAGQPGEPRRSAAFAGILIALAVLTRPNMLVCLPVLLLWLRWRAGLRPCLLLAVGSATVLLLMGAINRIHGGEFRILPWQGAHALWDGNGPEANGLYYRHSRMLPDMVPGTNPARAEAEAVYCAHSDCSAGLDRADFARFWRERTLAYIYGHPGEWLALMARKAWYAMNDYEQYNNKTYWLHKERSPWLRRNPLGFGLVLALAAGALLLPVRSEGRWLFLGLLGAYAAGLLLYFVSDRFRLPLVAWLIPLAGGWAVLLSWWRTQWAAGHWQRPLRVLGLTAVTATLTFWPVPQALREGTIGEDYALLASAALAARDASEAEAWASRLLQYDPGRPLGHALLCSARFVFWEQAASPALPERIWLEQSLSHCQAGAPASDRARYNAAFFLLALCRRDAALETFEALRTSRLIGAEARSALAALGWRPIDARESPSGLLALLQAENLAPGTRSIVDAALGRHCVENAQTPSPGVQDEP
jgi:hypothetical protein